ncbi:Conidiation-specific protein 8 [Ceratocystis lukuohia]|uniref:Conidiation-specific protein 8 n=1 Tax=Ceratocystis lukuohia TaxID=2019550 RepID=A0ABR4MEQ2_9PEZI
MSSPPSSRIVSDPTSLPPAMPTPVQAAAPPMTGTSQATASASSEGVGAGGPRRKSSLFQSLIDQKHHPDVVERRLSLSDQHRTPGFFGKMWKNYVMGSPSDANPPK